MRIIDLLVKQAKGEEMPKLVKYHNYIYAYDDELCNYEFEESYLFDYTSSLNDEVEVIEENKKIEKIDMFDYFTGYDFDNTSIDLRKNLEINFQILNVKINEIIDKLEELE